MIDPAHPLASWFLWVAAAAFLVVYGLPLLLAPLTWARWFQWELPGRTDLTVYFGRCLGGVALAIVFVGIRAAPHPAAHPLVFELIIVACGLMALVHIWGAIRKVQPWTENAEIVLYAGLTALAAWIYAGL
jgi:glucose dehydrogenase